MRGGWTWQYLPKLHMHLLFNPSVSLIKTNPQGYHTGKTWDDKCTLLFIATLVIARDWKWPKCPSARDWLEKLQSSHIMKLSKAQGRQHRASGVLSMISRNPERQLQKTASSTSHTAQGEHMLYKHRPTHQKQQKKRQTNQRQKR